MYRKKSVKKTSVDDEVIFVSPEGIKSLEAAIENLEHIYKEMAKATKKKQEPDSKQRKSEIQNN